MSSTMAHLLKNSELCSNELERHSQIIDNFERTPMKVIKKELPERIKKAGPYLYRYDLLCLSISGKDHYDSVPRQALQYTLQKYGNIPYCCVQIS